MIDLEHALTDLAEHLDHPAGDQLVDVVRGRLTTGAPSAGHRRQRSRTLLAVAAVFVLILATLIAVAPARRAIADWLGIGAVKIRQSEAPPRTHTTTGNEVPGSPGSGPDAEAATHLRAARTAVDFPIATPRDTSAGKLLDAVVDTRVPGGLVVLSYPRFTLVEVASAPDEPAPLGKQIGPATRIENVTVAGRPGVWLTGPHDVGYLDRTGEFRVDTVRRAGPTLIWERAGVTYRIEGLDTLAEAMTIAATLR